VNAAAEEPGCGNECQQALTRLEAYLDGELPNTDIDDLHEHLMACSPCKERRSFEEQLRSIVRRDCAEEAPAGLIARIEATLADG